MSNLSNIESNKFVKECIFSSLMILMEKNDFQKITITDITNKAGVSRMAFYRNYKVKEDIITDYLDELFESYVDEIRDYDHIDIYQFLCKFFAYFRKYNEVIKNLIDANISVLLLNKFDEYLHSILEGVFNNTDYRYELHYGAGGLYKVLIEWIKNGMEESDEEMAKIIYDIHPINFN